MSTGPRHRLRRYFITGLIVVVPLGVTVFVLVWLFRTLDAILGAPLQRVLPMHVPGVGLVLLLCTVFLIGWLAHYAIGRRLIAWGNALLARFPLTARIYNAASQLAQTFMGE